MSKRKHDSDSDDEYHIYYDNSNLRPEELDQLKAGVPVNVIKAQRNTTSSSVSTLGKTQRSLSEPGKPPVEQKMPISFRPRHQKPKRKPKAHSPDSPPLTQLTQLPSPVVVEPKVIDYINTLLQWYDPNSTLTIANKRAFFQLTQKGIRQGYSLTDMIAMARRVGVVRPLQRQFVAWLEDLRQAEQRLEV